MKLKDLMMVMCLKPEDYKLVDIRTQKPIMAEHENGSAIFQYIDELSMKSSKSNKINIEFFSPNPVGLLLDLYNEAMETTKKLFENLLETTKIDDYNRSTERLSKFTAKIYDFINEYQKTMIFGYTACEAFINLSIPDDYEYSNIDHKGVKNVFGKQAIERWLTCNVKMGEILVDIYGTPDIKKTILWNEFKRFQDIRNEIIHQKSSNTMYYEQFFKRNNLKILDVPLKIMSYFFEKRKDQETTNRMWPWLINSKNDFPMFKNFDFECVELVGSVTEGVVKQ